MFCELQDDGKGSADDYEVGFDDTVGGNGLVCSDDWKGGLDFTNVCGGERRWVMGNREKNSYIHMQGTETAHV